MEVKMMNALAKYIDEDREVALITVTDVQGSSPRGIGSMMIVDQKGNLLEGTIGGGALEEKAKQDGAICIKRGISKKIHYELNRSKSKDAVDMACGGSLDVFVKVFKGQDRLIIVGGGHIGVKLNKVAKILGYHTTIIDDRKECANKERFPDADVLKLGNIEEMLGSIAIYENSYIVIVTHGHKYDQAALEKVINSNARYIGMIGSKRKIAVCFKNMMEKGIEKELLDKVHTPIGLSIGGETPEEIAVAIMAEIQAVKHNKKLIPSLSQHYVVVKGGGDLATAVAHKLFRSGFQVVITEIDKPTMVRRNVSFANCIYEKEWTVEGVTSALANEEEIDQIVRDGKIPVLIDPTCRICEKIKPLVIVDAILAKENTGTNKGDAPIVIGMGPGFIAGEDVDLVIETNRGHNLGKVVFQGKAAPNTGIPGDIKGYTHQRILRSPGDGIVRNHVEIGSIVKTGELICAVGETVVYGQIDGVVRGLIKDGLKVCKNTKIGDIDPRGEIKYCYSISDKGRNIAGGVLEAILTFLNKK